MRSLIILLALAVLVNAQDGIGFESSITHYDVVIYSVDPTNAPRFNIRTFDNLVISFGHNANGLPNPTDDIIPDSLFAPIGIVANFTIPNDVGLWDAGVFRFSFPRSPFGTGYYTSYARAVGGYPLAESDWSGGQPFLLATDPSVPSGVNVGVGL